MRRAGGDVERDDAPASERREGGGGEGAMAVGQVQAERLTSRLDVQSEDLPYQVQACIAAIVWRSRAMSTCTLNHVP